MVIVYVLTLNVLHFELFPLRCNNIYYVMNTSCNAHTDRDEKKNSNDDNTHYVMHSHLTQF